MRTIKFRSWDGERMLSWGELQAEGQSFWDILEHDLSPHSLMQFTELHDKNGKPIYEGDVLEVRRPDRSTQTHTGDNIPMGSYTEPLEPIIHITRNAVSFKNGCFTINDEDDETMPLWTDLYYFDLDTAKEYFDGGWGGYSREKFLWNDAEEGDLQYLLSEYKLKDEADLLAFLGTEIIGNIYENPELLEPAANDSHSDATASKG